MIVDKHQNVEIQSRGFGRSEHMSIDENSLQHIMSVLTNLYSDPAMAVIREYSTNAYDSHVAANNEAASIDVKLPDMFEPVFRIKDYGVGLSEDEVYNIYGKYGASTKRDSNSYVGQLGLGCKSALTLTDQFTLIAIKNGVKNVFNIHLDESGIPSISKAAQSSTDAHNGVEVIVPISDVSAFRRKAEYFYTFFPGEINFVNEPGFKPANPNVYMSISDTIKLVDNINHNTVVMGGVPYRADKLFNDRLNYSNLKFLVYAEVGDVNFTPSREELHYTGKTIQFLQGVEATVTERILETIQDELATATSYKEAHLKFSTLDYSFMSFVRKISSGNINPKYQGVEVPDNFDIHVPVYRYSNDKFHKSELYATDNIYNTRLSNQSVFILTGKSESFTSAYKSKMKRWFSDNYSGHSFSVIYIPNGFDRSVYHANHDVVFSGLKEINVENELKSYKLARTESKKTPIKDMMFDRVKILYNRIEFTPEKVDASKPILMVSRKEAYALKKLRRHAYNTIFNFYNVYVVNKRQVKDFSKTYSGVQTYADWYTPILNYLDSITDKQLQNIYRSLGGDSYHIRRLFNSTEGIEDEDLKDYIEINLGLELSPKEQEFSDMFGSILHDLPHYSHHGLVNRVKEAQESANERFAELRRKVEAKYPLLSPHPVRTSYLEYVNLVHKEDK